MKKEHEKFLTKYSLKLEAEAQESFLKTVGLLNTTCIEGMLFRALSLAPENKKEFIMQ